MLLIHEKRSQSKCMLDIDLANRFPHWLLRPRDWLWRPDMGAGSSTRADDVCRTQAGFQLAKRYILASLPGSGIFSEKFQKSRFSKGPWVPLHLSFYPLYPHSVVFHLLTIATGWPTKCCLMLLAYSVSLHLPLLSVHIHTFCLCWYIPCRNAWL